VWNENEHYEIDYTMTLEVKDQRKLATPFFAGNRPEDFFVATCISTFSISDYGDP
jgi:hypothetical protein